MKSRFLPCLFALIGLAGVALATPLDPAERAASARYVNSLENADGGFRASAPDAKSELKNMSAATRSIHYFGGAVAHQRRVVKFVMDLYDPTTGAFHEPGAAADVRTTAMGLMTLAELKQSVHEEGPGIVHYFDVNAKTVPDIYLAEAALQVAGLRSMHPAAWLEPFDATHHSDGSYGTTIADTGRAVVTYLRLNAPLPDRAGAVKTLLAAQNADGGFGTSGDSDLATCYPVMRALFMLKEKPDLGKLRAFVDRCRNADGGYGLRPGEPSAVGSTYYASILLHWLEAMEK